MWKHNQIGVCLFKWDKSFRNLFLLHKLAGREDLIGKKNKNTRKKNKEENVRAGRFQMIIISQSCKTLA